MRLALAAALAVAGGASAASPPAAGAPRLTVPPAGGVAEAPEGHLVIAWEPAAAADPALPPPRYQLQTSRDGAFGGARTVDVGPALASLVSGLPDGETRVRVRAVAGGPPGPWSEPGTIRVDYPDLGLVWKLMALGGATLAALLAAIVAGARRAARHAAAEGPR